MDTRCPREREETNCLHYANAVQVQLTVAKNRCRYRGMLSRTSRGFLSSLSLSLSLHSTRRVTLSFLDSEDSLPRNEMVPRGWRSNRSLPIPTLHRWKFFLFLLFPPWILLSSFLFSFLCKKPRSLASPLPRGTMARRESFLFKKPMTGYVTMLVLSWTLSKPVVRVVKSFIVSDLTMFGRGRIWFEKYLLNR